MKIGELCVQDREIIEPRSTAAQERSYLSLEHIVSGSGVIIKDESLAVEDEGRSSTFAFDGRHVLYGKLRPYLNKVALPDFAGRCTTELIPLLPKPETDREFLAWMLRRKETVEFAMQGKTGSRMPRADMDELMKMEVPFVPHNEQVRIAGRLREQMAAVERARAAVQAQLDAAQSLIQSLLRESLKAGRQTWRIPECLQEVTEGIGERWSEFPVLGATRAGLAPAKEGVGKNPGRYKPVTPGTVFYNPMRILLGSIAIVDEEDKPGITSPDYVVVRGIEGRLHSTWFYYWFRSQAGAAFILSLTRGAVRERLLFKRLAKAQITIPSWETQLRVVEELRQVRKLRQSLETRLAEIELLPAALLRQAFSGKVWWKGHL